MPDRSAAATEEGVDRAAHLLLFLSAAGEGATFASCLDQCAVQARPFRPLCCFDRTRRRLFGPRFPRVIFFR
jgi:hypothetical protein